MKELLPSHRHQIDMPSVFPINDSQTFLSSQKEWKEIDGNHPFLRWHWAASWVEHMLGDDELLILVVKNDDGRWIGAAPFCIEHRKYRGRVLRFICSGAACGDYMNLLAAPGHFDDVVEQVVSWLEENFLALNIDAIELEGLACESQEIEYFLDRCFIAEFEPDYQAIEGAWVLDLKDSWEEQNEAFRASQRRKTKKTTQNLRASNFQVCTTDDLDFESIWRQFAQLHQLRRTSLGQPGCFADKNFEIFLKQAVRNLVAQDRASIRVIALDDRALSAYLLLTDSTTCYMYQSGMDPGKKNFEPGYMSATEAIQWSIESGYSKFDFLRGDEPYKERWGTKRTALSRVNLIPPKWSANLRYKVWNSGRKIKRLLSGDSSSDGVG